MKTTCEHVNGRLIITQRFAVYAAKDIASIFANNGRTISAARVRSEMKKLGEQPTPVGGDRGTTMQYYVEQLETLAAALGVTLKRHGS